MITDKKIEKLKGKDKRYTVALGESLYLRVQSSGHKSWVLRYSYCGRVRDITLGTWPELKVLQAKQAAHLKREELKLKPSAGLTLRDAYKLWQSKKKGHISSYVEECQRIELHLMPKLGKLQLEEITAPVVFNLLLNLQDEGKLPTLKRALMRLNEILELSVCAGLLEYNPCRKLSRAFRQHQPVNRPNITGSFGVAGSPISDIVHNFSGAFSNNGLGGNCFVANTNNGIAGGVDFKASGSNSIYGNSSIVQPPTLILNYVIKY